MRLAPIVLFVYRRPFHTTATLASLLSNPEAKYSDLIVFSDGPKILEHKESVAEVRRVVNSINGFRSLRVVERDRNFGLAENIVQGVSETVAEYGKVIVIEDDLVFSPAFLSYMNSGLSLYSDTPRVASIHAYCYPVRSNLPDTFFLRGADCWGWATWNRAWAKFRANGSELLSELQDRQLTKEFDLNGAMSFTGMLRDQIDGKNDSWAVRWHATCFLADLLTLYPGKTLVKNIGLDGSGTHCGETDRFYGELLQSNPCKSLVKVEENMEAKRAIAEFLRGRSRPSFSARIRKAIKSFFRI